MSQLYPFTDPSAPTPRRIVSGHGMTVVDDRGHEFLDAVAALWCSSLGFAPERLTDVAADQMRQLGYYHSFMGRTPDVADRFAKALTAKLPGDLNHVLFGTSGSEAVETATKLVRYVQAARGKPGKTRLIARDGAYHGSGQLSAALTGMSYCHDGFSVPLDAVLRTGRPHYARDKAPGESEVAFSKRRGRELEELIQRAGAETIGAFIGEPAMGAGGVILPPDGYWAEVQNVLARHDILLIADEIICGFGRTGRWFACETWDIHPDMMTLAKQMTASIFPMSAVAMTDAVHADVARQAQDFGTFGHGVTYGGHPVGAAVGLECLAVYEEMDLVPHVARLGDRLQDHLTRIRQLPGVFDTRRAGLLAAVEFNGDAFPGIGARIGAECEAHGVFFRVIGDVLAIAPPYIASEEDIDQFMEVMARAIVSVGTKVA